MANLIGSRINFNPTYKYLLFLNYLYGSKNEPEYEYNEFV